MIIMLKMPETLEVSTSIVSATDYSVFSSVDVTAGFSIFSNVKVSLAPYPQFPTPVNFALFKIFSNREKCVASRYKGSSRQLQSKHASFTEAVILSGLANW